MEISRNKTEVSRNTNEKPGNSWIPRKNQGWFLTPKKEPNQGKFLPPKKELMKEPRKELTQESKPMKEPKKE